MRRRVRRQHWHLGKGLAAQPSRCGWEHAAACHQGGKASWGLISAKPRALPCAPRPLSRPRTLLPRARRRRLAARLLACRCAPFARHRDIAMADPQVHCRIPCTRPAAAAGAAPRVLASAWALWGLGAASREQSKRSETTRAVRTHAHAIPSPPSTHRRFFASLFDRALAAQHRARCACRRPRRRAQEPPRRRRSSCVSGLVRSSSLGRSRRGSHTRRPVRVALA